MPRFRRTMPTRRKRSAALRAGSAPSPPDGTAAAAAPHRGGPLGSLCGKGAAAPLLASLSSPTGWARHNTPRLRVSPKAQHYMPHLRRNISCSVLVRDASFCQSFVKVEWGPSRGEPVHTPPSPGADVADVAGVSPVPGQGAGVRPALTRGRGRGCAAAHFDLAHGYGEVLVYGCVGVLVHVRACARACG